MRFLAEATAFIGLAAVHKFLDGNQMSIKKTVETGGSNLVSIRYTHFHLHARKNLISFYANAKKE
jgi:hypothetical protein